MGKQNAAKREKRRKNAIAAAERATHKWIKERQKPQSEDKKSEETAH